MEVYYDRENDELKLFLDRNEDGDEFWEWCNCKLSRK